LEMNAKRRGLVASADEMGKENRNRLRSAKLPSLDVAEIYASGVPAVNSVPRVGRYAAGKLSVPYTKKVNSRFGA